MVEISVSPNMHIYCKQDSDCAALTNKKGIKKLGCIRIGLLGKLCVSDPLETCMTVDECSIPSDCLHTSAFPFAICVPVVNNVDTFGMSEVHFRDGSNEGNDIEEASKTLRKQGNWT